MAFVKLDCGILDSTLWVNIAQRDLFITALLMATPHELEAPTPQLEVRSLKETGYIVQPGWYGFVHAAGVGIIRRAQFDEAAGLDALEILGNPDVESRSPEHDGRRMVRINGGYLILNYQKYRERDYTAADRSRRYREKQALQRDVTPSRRDITARTQVEVEVEVEVELYKNTAGFIFDLIQVLNPKHKGPNFSKWANDIRLMVQQDGRTDDEIRALFKWANQHQFWKTNILSPGTLRKQWDKLVIQRDNGGRGNAPAKLTPLQRAHQAIQDSHKK